MDMDALLTLASLVSFFALVATWIAAPLRAPQPAPAAELTQPAGANV
jgi:predicted ATPase